MLMWRGWLARLEQAEHPLLGPNLHAMSLVGMSPLPAREPLRRRLHGVLTGVAIAFVVVQFAGLPELWGDLGAVMDNLSLTTVSSMAALKLASMQLRRACWQEVIRLVSGTERLQLASGREEVARALAAYRTRSRQITYMYWVLVFFTMSLVLLKPLVSYVSFIEFHYPLQANESTPYERVFNTWVPRVMKLPPGYYVTLAMEVFIGYYGASLLVWDTFVVTIMIFFAGQYRLLQVECARIFGAEDDRISEEEARRRLIACYRHHLTLLECSKLFNACVSPVMFVYSAVCSVMLCAIAIQLTSYASTTVQLVWTLEYLAGTLTQLFIFYWHSNEVFYESGETERGAYESGWWRRRRARDASLRREVALLATGLRLRVVFTAGPFNHMTLATFTAILKGAYSYYTLLRTTTGTTEQL